jgi:glycosyltransferase involved in cell wall biosynthesis
MKILYFHYLCDGDTAVHHVRQFTAAARALGHTVEVQAMNLAGAAPAGPAADRAWDTGLRPWLKARWGRYLHEPKELAWNLRYAALERGLVRERQPDVLLVRDQVLTASCVSVAARTGVPLVLEVNAPAAESGLYLDQYAHIPRVPEWLERWKVRHADAVTVVSSALRAHLIARHGVEGSRITVVPNGADVHRFDPATPAASVLADGVPTVGFVGSFQKWHGCDVLADLIHAVAARRSDVRFVLVGDGPERAALEDSVRALGPRVVFTGVVPHDAVPGIVAGFDVGVMPESNFYGSPLKVIEWMAAGRAVVAPRYRPLEDVIDDGVHGLLFAPRDHEAMVGAVLSLLEDPGRRRALSEAAAARVRAELTWEHNARRVLGACEQAIAHQRRAAVRAA